MNLEPNFLNNYITVADSENRPPKVCIQKELSPDRLQSDIAQFASVHSIAKKIFEQAIPDLSKSSNLCLAYTGSDGRQEKINKSSNVEIQAIIPTKKDYDEELIKKIIQVLKSNLSIFHHELEIYHIDSDNLLMYKKGKRPFPTRALDSTRLIGSKTVMTAFKKKFQEHLKQGSTKILGRFRSSALGGSRKILRLCCETVKPNTEQINLASGTVSYNHKRIKGVKYPILRVIQYKLADLILELLKFDRIQVEKIPKSTIERIDFLAKKNLLGLSDAEAHNLKLNYAKALLWYAASEKVYLRLLKQTIQINSEEISQTARDVLAFSKKQLKPKKN